MTKATSVYLENMTLVENKDIKDQQFSELTPAQAEIASDLHRFRVVCCGRRFGKTTLSVLEMVGKAVSGPGIQVAYIAPTYGQARDIAWNLLKKVVYPVVDKINEARLEISVRTQGGGTSTIFLKGWESVETLRGMWFDLLVIDEVASMGNFASNWEEIIRPTLTDKAGSVLFISTPRGFNHFYDLYNMEARDPDYKSFHFTSYDNPYLKVGELDKTKLELTEDRFAQEYLADFRRTEGLVYKTFNRQKHLYDELPEITIVDRLLGVDFGFTNPTALLYILVDHEGNYWAQSEWYKTGQTNDQIIETVRSFKANKIYADPASPDRIAELKRAGFHCMEVIKGKDSIQNGIARVQELFKQGRLSVNKHCGNLIWELETYCYPEKRPDQPEPEIPIKENDHLLDALRYVLQTHHQVFVNAPIYIPHFD